MEQTELLALITESQTGDRKAQEQLVLRTQNQVYYHCLKILRNENDAMDASQDILISMLKGLKTLRDPDAFWAWLNQITCRTCCRQLARQRRQAQLLAAEAGDALLDDNLDDQSAPDRLLDSEENRRIIGELVDSLPETQRLCVLMYYYDEMSVKDIAAAMETSEGTVKSRLHYARQHIKKEVERYSSQGFALYGVSPLPFLSYFLQQEAAQTCLSAASAKVLGEAVLAAAAAGGTAAVGSAAAMAGSAKAALALAGLLLVGAVAGGALLHRPKSPEPEPVQAIQQDVPVRNEPGAPAIPAQPEPVVSEPEEQTDAPQPEPPAAVRLSPTPQPVLSIPAPELPSAPQDPAPTESPSPQPSLWTFSAPDILPEPVNFLIPFPSEPEPEPERKPEANPVYVPPSQWPEYVPPAPPPAQDPEPDPDPNPDPDPEPTVINQDLSDYGHDSGYGYISSFADQWDGELPENLTYTSSDPDVVYIDSEGNFITLSEGTAVLTAADPNDARFQYTLTVTVQDHFQWDYHIMDAELITGESTNWTFTSYATWDAIQSIEWVSDATDVVHAGNAPYVEGCHLDAIAPGTATVTGSATFHVDASDGTHVLRDSFSFQVTVKDPPKVEEASVSIMADGQPHVISQYFPGTPFSYAESRDPDVVLVEDGLLFCLAPGTADVLCYAESATWYLAAILHVTVEPAEPEPEPEPDPEPEPEPDPEPEPGDFHQSLPHFGLNSGYGYVSQFAEWWKGPLPETLEYESSDPSIVYIDAQGTFCTLAPGPATLTAFDPGNPDCKYILDIQVQDCFQWEHAASSETAYLGMGVTCCLYDLGWLSNLKSASIQWTSHDPGIADIDPSYYLMKWYDIRIIGVSLGTTTFTGTVTFQVETPLGIIEMHDTVTMEVTVVE